MTAGPGPGMVAAPPCAACRSPSVRLELIPPGGLPAEWERWPEWRREAFQRHDPGRWHLLYEGVAAGNGQAGDPVGEREAARIADAFREPYTYSRVHGAGLFDDAGFCERCDAPYCLRHWHVSGTGGGHCPRGHAKILDPYY